MEKVEENKQMKVKCDVCGEDYYSQTDAHDIGEQNICSEACLWELSHDGGEPKPIKRRVEIFYALADKTTMPMDGLYGTRYYHRCDNEPISSIITATPFKNCLVRITIEKMFDIEEGEM